MTDLYVAECSSISLGVLIDVESDRGKELLVKYVFGLVFC